MIRLDSAVTSVEFVLVCAHDPAPICRSAHPRQTFSFRVVHDVHLGLPVSVIILEVFGAPYRCQSRFSGPGGEETR